MACAGDLSGYCAARRPVPDACGWRCGLRGVRLSVPGAGDTSARPGRQAAGVTSSILRASAGTIGWSRCGDLVARPPRAQQSGLALVRPDEPCFAEDVPGHGRLDVLIAGQPGQRNRLVHREQPEYVVVRVIAGRRRRPQVTRPAEAVGPAVASAGTSPSATPRRAGSRSDSTLRFTAWPAPGADLDDRRGRARADEPSPGQCAGPPSVVSRPTR